MRRASFTFGLLLAVLLVGGCGGGSEDDGSASDEPITIGTVTAETGAFAYLDEPGVRMLKLKIDEVNKDGGIDGRQIKVISGNMESVPARGGQVAKEIIAQGATALFVSCDYDVGAPAALAAQRAGIPSFSCAASPKFGVQGIGDKAFSGASTDASNGAVGAAFALKRGWKNAFVLVDTTISFDEGVAAGFTKGFTDRGGRIIGKATYKNSDTSIATQITKIKAAKPGFILNASYPPGGVGALRQIRAAGINVPILVPSSLDGTLWNEAAPGVKDVYVVTPVSMFGDDPNPKVNDLFTLYKEKYGALPHSAFAADAYSAVEALVLGLQRADDPTNGDEIAAAVEGEPMDLLVGRTDYTDTVHIALDRRQAVLLHAEPTPIYQDTLAPATDITMATSTGEY